MAARPIQPPLASSPAGLQHFADAARADGDDGAGVAAVRAHQRGERIRFETQRRVAGIGIRELPRPLAIVHAGEAETDGNAIQRRLLDTGIDEGLAGGLLHGRPRAGDAEPQAGWPAGALGQFDAAVARKPRDAHAGAGAAAVDADEIVDHMSAVPGRSGHYRQH